jgi:uncharacterized protein (DUF2252 family)
MKGASFIADVAGKATPAKWTKLRAKARSRACNRTSSLEAPSWLWSSVVSLIGSHEVADPEHCRRCATQVSA